MSTLIEAINSQFGISDGPSAKEKTASTRQDAHPDDGLEEFEKLASVCEYVSEVGVLNLLKTAGALDPAHNAGKTHAPRKHIYVGHNAHSPSMSAEGAPMTNGGKQPGGKGGAYTVSGGKAKHPALKSNQSVIDMEAADHARHVSGDLKRVLKAIPFADPIPSHDLQHAKPAGEQNIHSGKAKIATDQELLKQAIAFKIAQQTEVS